MIEDRLDQLIFLFKRLVRGVEHQFNLAAEPEQWDALAYRWRRPGHFLPIYHPSLIALEDLLHIDQQKAQLVRNTEKFLAGLPANHALLWGARGTGKSTLIKGLLNRYAVDGLRVIEIEKNDLLYLPEIVTPLYQQPEHYILFVDDLSFDAHEQQFTSLKAMLDGSIASTPRNTLIYATSNRRHLMPEFQSENQASRLVDGELHHGEAVEEKISLSERFGLWLSFHPFKQEQYLDIVRHWVKRSPFQNADTRNLQRAALQFALYRGSRSGRVARQFVNDWTDREAHRVGGDEDAAD
ncbi:MAG: ATP-binding protein [Thiotrichales bacterium]